ncbi:hypothetical protein RND71_021668 [Anisodus tanguticus]|uniref:Phytocyanin domain-containing protein n=1 Tax=Anisodus tanguticus TaxID=243964 RepID=A0AAE1VFG1_9SOLA|nr:hypothetical protein RND71_021668 [Anisodus tanguticus]
MDKFIRMVIFGALAVAILLQVTTAQTEHVVGDDMGWTIPINGPTAYTSWASDRTFKVGDTLVFKFTTNNHDVQEVSISSFKECSTDNAVGESITTGPANVTLESPGDHYYICTMGKHCKAGQKLAITVSGTDTPGANDLTSNTRAQNALPPPSSSTIVFASFLFSLSLIALGIFL